MAIRIDNKIDQNKWHACLHMLKVLLKMKLNCILGTEVSYKQISKFVQKNKIKRQYN